VTDLELVQLYPPLATLSDPLRQRLASQAQAISIPAGNRVFDAGMTCQTLPLILAGRIKVSKRADNGREIRLYSVEPGDLCVVTLSCLLGNAVYPASGVVEQDLRALVLPQNLFTDLVASHAGFREFVFTLYATRLTELMQLVEEVAFCKLDQRLAGWLCSQTSVISSSHQRIADELGSVREIVSRLLKQFEEAGLLRLGRERIEILDAENLRLLASK
jgi:CRP/FNR family transcriptional regulator